MFDLAVFVYDGHPQVCTAEVDGKHFITHY
jgi:hypothetical protein